MKLYRHSGKINLYLVEEFNVLISLFKGSDHKGLTTKAYGITTNDYKFTTAVF